MCRDCRFAVMQARLSRLRLGWKPCLGGSNAASAQQAASLSERCNFDPELRWPVHEGLTILLCAERLAQNQNCFRLGHYRFPEVPLEEKLFVHS
jgi:hypothetical protein